MGCLITSTLKTGRARPVVGQGPTRERAMFSSGCPFDWGDGDEGIIMIDLNPLPYILKHHKYKFA